MIQYGKQTIEEDDIQSIIDLLKENKYLTTGPRVKQFEETVAELSNRKYGVAVSNGTAALHCATNAICIKEDDEVIVPAISFIASSNCVLYQGGTPVFCDIDPNTMNIDTSKIEALITDKTKAIITVDFAGQLCDYEKLRSIKEKYNLVIIQDAAHSFGVKLSDVADLTTYSFHPVKNITTGEGGMIVTNNEVYNQRMMQFRSHGIDADYTNRKLHYYDMIGLGFNYRLTDLQCALGLSQVKKLDKWIKKRNEIALFYDETFKKVDKYLTPLEKVNECAYHIYIIKLNLENINSDRDTIFEKLKGSGIGVNVHYKPIYLNTYYKNLGYEKGLCPIAEKIYDQIITIPIYPTLKKEEMEYVANTIVKLFE